MLWKYNIFLSKFVFFRQITMSFDVRATQHNSGHWNAHSSKQYQATYFFLDRSALGHRRRGRQRFQAQTAGSTTESWGLLGES